MEQSGGVEQASKAESNRVYVQVYEGVACIRESECGWNEVWGLRSVSQKGNMGLSAKDSQTRRRPE